MSILYMIFLEEKVYKPLFNESALINSYLCINAKCTPYLLKYYLTNSLNLCFSGLVSARGSLWRFLMEVPFIL